MSKELSISASRIKALDSCSWSYYCKYHLRIPEKSNTGASRGVICHLVFELLFNPRHKKYVKKILKQNSAFKIPSIKRLIEKHAKKVGINDEENLTMVDEMIIVGLKTDFYPENGKVVEPEYEFNIQGEGYKAKGFIDLPIIYEDKKTIKIRDYKSSKAKFKGEELTFNVQAMMYSIVAKKLWPEYKPIVEFIFLRFPKAPIQAIEFSNEQLEGYEYVLQEVYKKIENFSEKDACSNFAADEKATRWLCGKEGGWICPFRKPLTYYSIFDEEDNFIKSAFTHEEILKFKTNDSYKIKKYNYSGCPKFNS